VVITSNLGHRNAPGNVFLSASESGLEKDSVVNVSQFYTLDKDELEAFAGAVPPEVMLEVEEGLRYILSL